MNICVVFPKATVFHAIMKKRMNYSNGARVLADSIEIGLITKDTIRIHIVL
jgi:hypothetical protein